jgi:hypothetical protein
VRLEHHLGAAEALVSDGKNVPVGKLVGALDVAAARGLRHFLVNGDIAEGVLDGGNNLSRQRWRTRGHTQ